MTRPTLVFLRYIEINGRAYRHGDELRPDSIADQIVNRLLDEKVLSERPERRSLYRLFPAFSGVKEREQLTRDELAEHALPYAKG
jgi:hypothetical protein